MTLARVLAGFGKTLIAAGVIILLFAAYQLWGTGIHERQAQDDLAHQFSDVLTAAGRLDLSSLATTTTASTVRSDTPTTATAPAPPPTVPKSFTDLLYPDEGHPVALIRIPAIGVNKVVVEGTGIEDLKNGPGHFSDTPLPGQAGNAAIAGHRTTYGAPFGDIDQLNVGDEISVTTVLGEAVYKVAGTRIVEPTQVEVVGDFGDNRLTLTACHPKYSASKRIVVWATLKGQPVPTVARPDDRKTVELPGDAPTTTAPPTTLAPSTTEAGPTTSAPTTTAAPTTVAPTSTAAGTDAIGDGRGLSGDPDAWPPTLAWAAACAAVALAAWSLGRVWERRSAPSLERRSAPSLERRSTPSLERRSAPRRYRRFVAYVVASPLFLFCLYSCFTHVDRLLPAY